MCGIAGVIGPAAERPALDAMLESLKHRGPDDSGIWRDDDVALGHRRLAVIDLSSSGHQPMEDEAAVIVFNGVIYNYRKLRADLKSKGYVFSSHSDTEVILKAYREWGEDAARFFPGMFAFAIWDKLKRRLILARDRFGIKPLYYTEKKSQFAFASSPKALVAAGLAATDINPDALQFHFSLHAVIPAPMTILAQVSKLEPAHILEFNRGRIAKKRYWELISTINHKLSHNEWLEHSREKLKTAVKRRVEAADVPVGLLLSGGLDSSLLAALLAEEINELQTFSIGFPDEPEEKGSEFEYSDLVVELYHTRHQKIVVPAQFTLESLPDAVSHMTEPMFGQDAVGFYLLAREVSRQVKVVMSGQGADEVFGGYFWYPLMNEARGSDFARFAQFYLDRDFSELQEMLNFKLKSDLVREWLEDKFNRIKADSYLGKVLNLDVCNLIVDDPVKRVDNMTMAWGLEARVPFLDHELVEFAASMPDELKLSAGGKGILKTVARGLVPDEVIHRPKGYFPVPALKYVRGEFLQWMSDILLSSDAIVPQFINRNYLHKLLANPEQHLTKIRGSKLWQLALTELWIRRLNRIPDI